MSFERIIKESDGEKIDLEIETGFENFVPLEFKQDPFGYFERTGKEIRKDEKVEVRNMPVWHNEKGEKLKTVAKNIITSSDKKGSAKDSLFEYKIIRLAHSLGLPAPNAVTKAENKDKHLMVVEEPSGFRWKDREEFFREYNLNDEEVKDIKKQAGEEIKNLREIFKNAGIAKDWKMEDLVFDVDFNNRKINNVTPLNFEKSKINWDRFMSYQIKGGE